MNSKADAISEASDPLGNNNISVSQTIYSSYPYTLLKVHSKHLTVTC